MAAVAVVIVIVLVVIVGVVVVVGVVLLVVVVLMFAIAIVVFVVVVVVTTSFYLVHVCFHRSRVSCALRCFAVLRSSLLRLLWEPLERRVSLTSRSSPVLSCINSQTSGIISCADLSCVLTSIGNLVLALWRLSTVPPPSPHRPALRSAQ